MVIISDSRARPAGWLLAAFGVALICFWYPASLGWQLSHSHSEDYRELVAEQLHYFPLALLASLVALFSYVALWRRSRGRGGWASRCLLSVGTAVFLVTLGPVFLLLVGLVALVMSSFAHPA